MKSKIRRAEGLVPFVFRSRNCKDTGNECPGRTRKYIFALALVLFVSISSTSQSKVKRIPSDREVRVEGELEIVYEDAHPSSRVLYFLNSNGRKLALQFHGDPPASLRAGMHVKAHGVQVGETLELNSGEISSLSAAPAVSGNPLGQHRVLVIMVNFQDKQAQPFSQSAAQSVLTNTSDYFREASYGQTWLTGDVYGWFTIPVSSTTCDTTAIANYAQAAAASAGANLSAYEHLVYAFPQNACAWQGRASVGGSPANVWVNEWFELGIVGHEIGHNYGLYHSRSMDCGANSIGSNCTTEEYGDTFDLMGAANSAHFNLYQKERLGWINSANNAPITTVSSSGSYWIESFESANMNPKGLKILKSQDPVTGLKTWYYIEHRAATGFDSFLSGNTNVLNGVILRTGSEVNGQDTYLLDMTPSTSSWYDPALMVGQSFTDTDAGATITVITADASGALVEITMAPQPCSRANPTVTVSPGQSPWVRSGATVSFDVSVRNNDGSGCNSSIFNWQGSVLNGWLVAFATQSPALAPGATATTTMQVTSAGGAADGFYNVSATATNSSAAAYLASGSATYALVSGLSVSASATQSTYMRSQAATVNATVRAAGVVQSGVPVTFTMTKANGTIVTSTVTTGSNGVAVFKYAFNRKKDPAGTYQVRAQASLNGVSGSGSVSFAVK
jgi:metallopeptidase family M12-like protein